MSAEPEQLRTKALYRIPGLNGAWRLMGLGTTGLGSDGRATLHLIRDWDHDAAELLQEVVDLPVGEIGEAGRVDLMAALRASLERAKAAREVTGDPA